MSGSRRSLAIIGVLALAVVGLLLLGRSNGSDSIRARTDRIAGSIKCPTCQGLSVAQSKASTAQAIYVEIERQVTAGQTDEQIRTYLVTRFGEQQLLRPETTGIGSIAWIAPVVAVVVGLAALIRVFTRTRVEPVTVSDAERNEVARAIEDFHESTS